MDLRKIVEAGCELVYLKKPGRPGPEATYDVISGKPRVVEWVLGLARGAP